MARRSRGDGSVYRTKDGSWRGAVSLGRGPDGRRIRRYVSGRTKTAVLQQVQRIRRESSAGGQDLAVGSVTVEAFLARWLESVRGLAPSTWRSYESVVRVHVVPALGRVRMRELTPLHVQAMLDGERRRGTGGRTLLAIYQTLHRALAMAVRWRVVASNAAQGVEAPRHRRQEGRALDPAEVAAVLRALEGNRLHALYVVAAHTGMRQGELLALGWEHVDLAAGRVRVERTLLRGKVDEDPRFGAPKTASSRRVVPLGEETVEVLRAHRRRQLQERLGAGGAWRDYGLVFCRPDGGALRCEEVTVGLQRAMEAAGVGRGRFHDLRHTFATVLTSGRHSPRVVAGLLGHASTRMTLDVYSHATEAAEAEAMRDMIERIGGGGADDGCR